MVGMELIALVQDTSTSSTSMEEKGDKYNVAG
jgi:hypothetical protein